MLHVTYLPIGMVSENTTPSETQSCNKAKAFLGTLAAPDQKPSNPMFCFQPTRSHDRAYKQSMKTGPCYLSPASSTKSYTTNAQMFYFQLSWQTPAGRLILHKFLRPFFISLPIWLSLPQLVVADNHENTFHIIRGVSFFFSLRKPQKD